MLVVPLDRIESQHSALSRLRPSVSVSMAVMSFLQLAAPIFVAVEPPALEPGAGEDRQ